MERKSIVGVAYVESTVLIGKDCRKERRGEVRRSLNLASALAQHFELMIGWTSCLAKGAPHHCVFGFVEFQNDDHHRSTATPNNGRRTLHAAQRTNRKTAEPSASCLLHHQHSGLLGLSYTTQIRSLVAQTS